MVEAWLLTVVSPDDWKEKYEPILSASYQDEKDRIEIESKWGSPDENGRGEFKLTRVENPNVNSNISFKPAAKPL